MQDRVGKGSTFSGGISRREYTGVRMNRRLNEGRYSLSLRRRTAGKVNKIFVRRSAKFSGVQAAAVQRPASCAGDSL